MMRQKLITLLFIIISLALFFVVIYEIRQGEPRINEADQEYLKGESAATIAERKKGFNHALTLYLELEKEYQPRFGNGKLDYNIGSTFFQLEEYPWAVLYYQRSQALMPREEKIQRNLSLALQKLALPPQNPPSVFSKVFFIHTYFSLPERLQAFFLFSLAAISFGSIFVWTQRRWLKKASWLFLILAAIMLSSLGYTRYLSPVEGVIVHSVDLRRDAGGQYAKATEQPIPAGSNVEVLSLSGDGKWIKVSTQDGIFGYVPQDSIRLLD